MALQLSRALDADLGEMGETSVTTLAGRPSGLRPTALDSTLQALTDPTRRGILLMLRDAECSAGEIAARFCAISRPAVSQHLGVLAAASLVEVRRVGNRRLYRARPEGLDETWTFIEDMWRGALHRLKHAAEQAEADRRRRTNTTEPTGAGHD